MFESVIYSLLYLAPILYNYKTCAENLPYQLNLLIPGDPEYTDIVVKRVGDQLTLKCELGPGSMPRRFVWNTPTEVNQTGMGPSPYTVDPVEGKVTLSSVLVKEQLEESDSGHYMCSAPPYSQTKYILVQPPGPRQCARSAFWCGSYCVLALYVCDGRADCAAAEDEAPHMCDHMPCARPNKLNCSSGRCISESACCRGGDPLCQQPPCCAEHPRYSTLQGHDADFPPLFEDRHAPDDYGFIQSTIYTVTACALIFMIAVVLLVSAICKMHMKRAALRSYAHAERATAHHYNMHYAQSARFPPCYEASRLLDARTDPTPAEQCSPLCEDGEPPREEPDASFGLARLSNMFAARYRQVPTQCLDVEMTDVRTSTHSSPSRSTRTRLDNYRSPTFCDLNTDLLFNAETSDCGRDLNYMATQVDFFRRRSRGNLDRVDRPRPLTLQLGRFQLSIPRLGRRTSLERRPDTPNVAELNIDDLDFVRLNSNDTYTLNGRTIRLLGANFENYPHNVNDPVRPPPYNEAMRYKLYGPPPEYLSRDALNNATTNNVTNEEEARSNVEMPPCYDELASGDNANGNVVTSNVANDNVTVTSNVANDNVTVTSNDAVMDNVVATGNAERETDNVTTLVSNVSTVLGNAAATGNVTAVTSNVTTVLGNVIDNVTNVCNVENNVNSTGDNGNNNETHAVTDLNAVIDNLPAIDCDVNANEAC